MHVKNVWTMKNEAETSLNFHGGKKSDRTIPTDIELNEDI